MSTAREDMMAEYGEARRKHESRQAERVELSRLILGRTTTTAVEAILAAGFRKPQQVTTVEELDALPIYSVVLSEGVAYQHYGQWEAGGTAIQWSAEGRWWSTSQVDLPATVLHVGGDE